MFPWQEIAKEQLERTLGPLDVREYDQHYVALTDAGGYAYEVYKDMQTAEGIAINNIYLAWRSDSQKYDGMFKSHPELFSIPDGNLDGIAADMSKVVTHFKVDALITSYDLESSQEYKKYDLAKKRKAQNKDNQKDIKISYSQSNSSVEKDFLRNNLLSLKAQQGSIDDDLDASEDILYELAAKIHHEDIIHQIKGDPMEFIQTELGFDDVMDSPWVNFDFWEMARVILKDEGLGNILSGNIETMQGGRVLNTVKGKSNESRRNYEVP